jgi:hypothetical protein
MKSLICLQNSFSLFMDRLIVKNAKYYWFCLKIVEIISIIYVQMGLDALWWKQIEKVYGFSSGNILNLESLI